MAASVRTPRDCDAFSMSRGYVRIAQCASGSLMTGNVRLLEQQKQIASGQSKGGRLARLILRVLVDVETKTAFQGNAD